ncbi:MAG TPA: peroxiredoxin [Candidatus Saccharimonadia bacterium]|nr:peroxiredoxin [Candidatus Saccharimonadia bacterium]
MKPAPDFRLPDQSGTIRSLKDYAGKWLVLYFYPEDDTPGCTIEACAFRDDYPALQARGLSVVGVSRDSVESHQQFAEKHHLNFPILADESRTVHEAYGAWGKKKTLGVEYVGATRKTFLINPQGQIAKEYPKVTPMGHSAQIMKDFTKLAGPEGSKPEA